MHNDSDAADDQRQYSDHGQRSGQPVPGGAGPPSAGRSWFPEIQAPDVEARDLGQFGPVSLAGDAFRREFLFFGGHAGCFAGVDRIVVGGVVQLVAIAVIN